jgi:hypothetical protein
MAIIGKQFTAVIARTFTTTSDLQSVRTLYYNSYITSEEEIATLYPGLSWDLAAGMAGGLGLRTSFLGRAYPTALAGGYADDEEAIRDIQSLTEGGLVTGDEVPRGVIFFQWVNGAWLSNDERSGSPTFIWGKFPDANTYNDDTAAPFGTGLGAGVIRHQAVYWNGDVEFGYVYGMQVFQSPVATQYPDTPRDEDIAPVDGVGEVSKTIGLEWVDVTYIFTPVDNGLPEDDASDEEIAGFREARRLRVWGFSLDGHDFYVLRVGQSLTLVYDLTTQEWAEWRSPGLDRWRPHVGQNWVGASVATMGLGYTDVVAGDDESGVLWLLDPASGRDDRLTTGNDSFPRTVTGGLQVTGRDVMDCGAVTIDIALGSPTQTGASLTLDISDDFGKTFLPCGNVTITADDNNAVVEWRSLGTIKAPGRIFRFSDDGGTVRIGGANVR